MMVLFLAHGGIHKPDTEHLDTRFIDPTIYSVDMGTGDFRPAHRLSFGQPYFSLRDPGDTPTAFLDTELHL